jgi:hypothetical protein
LRVYEVFAQEKHEASITIAKLEFEVSELEERLEHEQRFDLALINGGGRGRPKSGAFVSHVRCLLATGLNLSRPIVVFLCLASSCLVFSCLLSS